ncbi:MAG TPA: DUF4349 domain-containing protein [Acidimicrobiales bacterium]|nr:DUF4349 domain-containing protein [Acidimicrobiales bacterium]
MITEDELDALLHEAGGGIAVPAHGPAAILAAAASPTPEPTVVRGRFRFRELALAGVSVAAVVALAVVLVTSSGSSPGVSSFLAANPAARAALGPRLPAAGVPKSTTHGAPAASGGREIIATGTLRLEVTRAALGRDVAQLDALAARFGGYVSAANIAESGTHPGGTIVIAVPAASFSLLIAKAEAIGRVRSLSTTKTDVTAQVVDLGARLTALVDERNQLEVLLGRAGKVSDLLAVENEIEYVQSQIEQIQGEQRTLAAQVSYSSLTVDLAVPRPPHVSSSPNGFSHAWHQAVSGFVNGVKALVAHLGDLLFGVLAFLVAALLVFGLWRGVWPRVRRRIA